MLWILFTAGTICSVFVADYSESDPLPASGEPAYAHGDGGLNLTTTAPDLRSGDALLDQWMISTLDDKLDIALNGGIHSGYLTEITGERFVDDEIFNFRNRD